MRVKFFVVALVATVLTAAGLSVGVSPASAVTPVAQPRISVGPDVVVGEADGTVDVPVTLSAPGQSVVTVNYQTEMSTAVVAGYGNPDYVTVSGTLTFAPGETTKDVVVSLTNDATPEGLESFTLDLTRADERDDRRAAGCASASSTTTPWSTPAAVRPRRDRRRVGRHRERPGHPGRPRAARPRTAP